jgi:hypothetical protein
MGFHWKDDIDCSLQGKLLNRAVAVLPTCNSVDLSAILNGLAGMKYDWKNEGKMEKAICEGIITNYHPTKKRDKKSDGRGIANIVYYLGKLSKEREEGDKIVLEKEVLESILNGIEKCVNQLNAQGASNLIYGYECFAFFFFNDFWFLLLRVSYRLAGLNLFWEEIPVSVRNVLQSTIKRLEKEFIQQHISNIIYRYVNVLSVDDISLIMFAFSCGVMEVNWQDLTIKPTLYSEMERLSSGFSSQECSNIIYG